jgi:branched-chain amino acid transport system substrate-binding protein
VALGSKIAAAEINAAGGVNGRKITVITEDDGYIPARSFQALTKLIESTVSSPSTALRARPTCSP